MKIKTSELTGVALDWAVAKCEGVDIVMRHNYMRHKAAINNYTGDLQWHLDNQPNDPIWVDDTGVTHFMSRYSIDSAQGFAIIERESIGLLPAGMHRGEQWLAFKYPRTQHDLNLGKYGPTLLIAAMRTYVAYRLGDEVDVPEELL